MLREEAELPNYAVSTELFERIKSLYVPKRCKARKYCSIYSWSTYYRGGCPTGCERHSAGQENVVIGQSNLTLQPAVEISGHS
jgi:hypothetical protein